MSHYIRVLRNGGKTFSGAVQSGINTGPHGGKLVGYANKESKVRENLLGIMHEVAEADTHCWDP